MALIDKDKIKDSKNYQDKDTGLRIDVDGKEKAVVLSKQVGKPIKTKRHNKGWWPDEKKIEAATMYIATGNVKKTSHLTSIPEKTIFRWMQEDWWDLTIQRVRREENAMVDKKFSTIVDKALVKLEQRIEHGDMVYDIKKGVVVPIEVSARDLAIVTGTIFDKRQLLRGEATKITATSTSEEHLKKLADQFSEYVKSKQEKVVNSVPEPIEQLPDKT